MVVEAVAGAEAVTVDVDVDVDVVAAVVVAAPGVVTSCRQVRIPRAMLLSLQAKGERTLLLQGVVAADQEIVDPELRIPWLEPGQ